MTITYIELVGDLSGKKESEPVTLSADGEVHISYYAQRCYSAWVEAELPNKATLRFPFFPHSDKNPKIELQSGTKVKIVSCMGNTGVMRANLIT